LVFPLAIFIVFHKGRTDPMISYQRYLAPFIFLFYPWIAALVFAVVKFLTRRIWIQSALVCVVLVFVAVVQLNTAFIFENDDSTQGIAVGKYILSYRQQHPETINGNALTEFLHWQYLGVHVGASDVRHLIYDRPMEFSPRKPSSLIGASPDQVGACLKEYRVDLVSLRTPEIQQAFENSTKLQPTNRINGYNIYVVPQNITTSMVKCALVFGSIR
jgi:hypothetical protein